MGISSSKSKTTNEPWAPAQPYVLEGLKQTQRVFDKVQPQTEKYGAMSFDTYGRVAPGAEAGIRGSQNLVNDTIAGKYLNANPYIDSLVAKQAGDIRTGVGAAFSGAGRYGSGMMGDNIADNIANASNQLRYQNFADERQNQVNAVGQSQDLMRGSQGLLEQAATLPWTGVQALNGGVRTASNGYGTTTTKSSDPMGTLVGLAGAGATAYASDERIKDVKRKVGETPQGLGIYDYEYKGSDDLQRGLLAQEVEREQPQAMGPTVGGVKTVNYDALGVPPPAGAMAVDYSGLKQNVPTIPKPQSWLDGVISPDASTTKGKIGLLGHALMAAGSQPFQALGKGLLGIRAEQREQLKSEGDQRYREAQIAEMERKGTEPEVKVVGNNIVRFGRGGANPEAIYTAPMEAERYAGSLGYIRGTPEYDRAVQDYVLRSNGPTALDADQEMADYRQKLALGRIAASGGETRRSADYRESLTRSRPQDAKAMSTGNVVAPVLAKIAAGQPLTTGEQEVLRFYKPTAGGKSGGPPSLPNSPVRGVSRASARVAGKSATRYATNPKTGERLQLVNGKWVPAR